jgi:hypothetical protein
MQLPMGNVETLSVIGLPRQKALWVVKQTFHGKAPQSLPHEREIIGLTFAQDFRSHGLCPATLDDNRT